jgi:glycosyltransferase involved in cell wall biosynthesis
MSDLRGASAPPIESIHSGVGADRFITAKTAIVHDWFQGYHGSERVVETIREGLFRQDNVPDIYTFHAARDLLPAPLAAAIAQESRLASLPGVRQAGHTRGFWRYLLPAMPAYFRHLELDEYDLVIASSHACAVHARPRPGITYVCYCHTPMRYAWMPEMDRRHCGGAKGVAVRAAASWLRRIDRKAALRPDSYIANSQAVRERIRMFYGRDAVVIHPPVELEDLRPTEPEDPPHFLWVHRLVPYKHPEIVAAAFRDLPYRLTMVGVGPLEERLRANLPPNVELIGWVSRRRLVDLYARSAGFIHIGIEDFGMSMVEALASGTPVIALDRGGAVDIVTPGEHGMLIQEPTVGAVRAAVRELVAKDWDRDCLARRAGEFSRQRFLDRLFDHLGSLNVPIPPPRN